MQQIGTNELEAVLAGITPAVAMTDDGQVKNPGTVKAEIIHEVLKALPEALATIAKMDKKKRVKIGNGSVYCSIEAPKAKAVKR
jgi:hypothetical protein